MGIGEAQYKETHDIAKVQQPEYSLHLGPCLESLGVSRVAVYTHNSLMVVRRRDLEDTREPVVCLQLGLPNQKKILLLCGYRQWKIPGTGQENSRSIRAQEERWNRMLETWNKAIGEEKETVMLMDANINSMNWTVLDSLPNNHYDLQFKSLVNSLFEKIMSQGVTMLVKQPTHLWVGKATRALDHIYTTHPEKVSDAEVLWTGMSDHALIRVKRYTKKLTKVPRYVRKRVFKSFDKEQYKELVARMPELEQILDQECPDRAAELLTQGLTRVLDRLAPLKTIQTRKDYAPHLSQETKKLMKERKEAQSIAARTGNQDHLREARHLRNRVVDSRRKDRRRWEQEKLSSEGRSPAEVWKGVKGVLGWGDSGPPTRVYHEGKFVNTPKGLAKTMNQFFWTKVDNLRKGIPSSNTDPLEKVRENMQGRRGQFSFRKVTKEEIKKTILNMKTSTATGIDWIDSNCLKVVADIVTPALTHITNLSIEKKQFPKIYKVSKIIPLKKSADLSDMNCSSYRPVNLLPLPGKIVERAVFSQVAEYLEENRLLHHNHHGGRKGHSTATALIQMYDKWVEELEEGKLVGALMVDQSAAFDLCDHLILEGKVDLLLGGGGGEQVNPGALWVRSYLAGRSQCTIVDGHISDQIKLPPVSVIQGGVGAGLLYLCYTTDLPDAIHDHNVNREEAYCIEDGAMVNFVDDGTNYIADKDPQVVSRKLCDNYKKIENWMHTNKLVINADKTHYIVAATRKTARLRDEVKLQAGGYTIKQSENQKLLGAVVANTAKWNMYIRDHKNSIIKQLNSRINALKMLQNGDSRTKLIVATAVVQSKLQYLMPLWGGAPDYLLQALQVQQLKAARLVWGYDSFYWSTEKLLNKCNWLSVKQQVYYSTCVLAHSIIRAASPYHIYSGLVHNRAPYNTRAAAAEGELVRYHTWEAYTGHSSLTLGSFRCRAQRCYSSLPVAVRTGSLVSVKAKIKKHVKQNVLVR